MPKGIRAGWGPNTQRPSSPLTLAAGGTVVAVVAVVGAMVIGAVHQMTRGVSDSDSPRASAREQARLERRQTSSPIAHRQIGQQDGVVLAIVACP